MAPRLHRDYSGVSRERRYDGGEGASLADQFSASEQQLLGDQLCPQDPPLEVDSTITRTFQNPVFFIYFDDRMKLGPYVPVDVSKSVSLPGSGNST